MTASLKDSVTSAAINVLSNSHLPAKTVEEIVMAEQVSHHVVNYTESMSGSPLVDVAANQTNAAAADFGTTDALIETKTDSPGTSQLANHYATQPETLISSATSDAQAETEPVTEPSAGEVADSLAPSALLASDLLPSNQSTLDDVHLDNNTHEIGNQADVLPDDGSQREDSVDISLNSDTEGSRGEGDLHDAKKDDLHHVRSNSVKKPTTFSKVSVTKNFLTKSSTATPPLVKSGDKPSPAGTPPQPSALKPRLIAKTGTSLRDVQKARMGTEAVGGPDASKVWNKNRPIQPPPPKQFTDEELKQQYGIHLATRLQTDEDGKQQSKWADIDEDEEDWAPETVEWMDGTKSTLMPNEIVTPVKEQIPGSSQPSQPTEGTRPILAMKKPVELGPTKTILKPGASAAAAQARQSASGAGTPTERSGAMAKDFSAAPAKSPWATLPPVESMSPINPPVQQMQPPLPFASQDARSYEPAPPQQPAREIAADTFDRSWREGEGGARELFNSANGRYEPVPEGRRSSIKPDSAYRKPAVLQRPSQQGAAPAEPSAAFQTRSTSQADGSWARRRGSSVSQGSLPPGRRMSLSKTSEVSPVSERRTSTVIGHDLRASPQVARAEPAQPMFSQQSAWQQQMPPRPESGAEDVQEDPVKVQERVMREKRELAKKRRQEEEEQLEAEKQERLKARLAALAGAGKSRREREAESAAATVQTPSSETLPATATIAAAMDEVSAQSTEPAAMPANAAQESEEHVVSQTGEWASAKPPSLEEAIPSPIPQIHQTAELPERPVSSTDQAQRQQAKPHLSPRANARAPFQQPGAQYKPSVSSYSSPGDRKQQPFDRSPLPNSNSFTLWGSAAPTGNVWGSSGIGNGTFEGANIFAPMPMTQQSSSLPPPPGMTRQSASNRISPQSLGSESRSPNLQQQSVAEPSRGFGPPGLDVRPDAFAGMQNRVNGASPAPGIPRQAHLPGPIAPPSRAQQHQQPVQRQDPLAAWNNATQKLPYQYKNDVDAAERKQTDALPHDDTFKETFKQTSVDQGGRLGAPRRFDKTEFTVYDAQGSRSVQALSPAPPNAQTQPSGPFSTASPVLHDSWKAAGENTVRIPDPSLNAAHGGLPAQLSPIGPPSSQQPAFTAYQVHANHPVSPLPPASVSKEQSPPPPEPSSFQVDSEEVHVKLPPAKPNVKLPPASTPAQPQMPQHNAGQFPQRPISNWGAPGSSKPIVMQEAWQARFNGLFNRTPIHTETPPSPPKTPPKTQGPSPTVTSSSRTMMEAPLPTAATVSLPQLPQVKRAVTSEGFTIDDSEEVTSKPTMEQMFNEELSHGSLPKINLPRNLVYGKFFEPASAHNLLWMGPHRPDMGVQAQAEPEYNLLEIHQRRRDGYFVHLPTTKLVKRLIRHGDGSRQPSGLHQERKPSGKFVRKNTPSMPMANGVPGSDARKTSFQKNQASAPGSPVTTSSPVTNSTARKTSWARPPKGRGRGPPTVKAA